MDGSRIVKWIIVLAVVFAAWKFGIPWVKQHTSQSATASAVPGDNSCLATADRAAQAWGSGIGKYANPPYDVDAWSNFKSDVESKISAAETACSASTESCAKARDAMHDLRSLVSDLDTAIRSGAPPAGDIVQRQANIDAQLDTARDLVRSGK
jgi:hypothetical protein